MFICCQIGAREHYAIPRLLHQNNQLNCLITDTWVQPNSYFYRLPFKGLSKLRDRFHHDLNDAHIKSFTNKSLLFEISKKSKKNSSWEIILERNQWFQHKTINYLKILNFASSQKPILFTYSYAGLEILKYAKQLGWQTILGQIDPGPLEEKIVAQENNQWHSKYPIFWEPAPSQYWNNWHQECEITDYIFVNSEWSKTALINVGISEKKIHIIPLAYEASHLQKNITREYPNHFSHNRPMRVLFLGQVILRKGIAHVLEVAKQLKTENIEFWIIGKLGIKLPQEIKNLKNIIFIDSIPRSQVDYYYQQADVFLFPTLSDGFGLTQLEAQSFKLPIITSNKCGNVITDNKNGIVLSEISEHSITNILLKLLYDPKKLEYLSKNSVNINDYNLQSVYRKFIQSIRE